MSTLDLLVLLELGSDRMSIFKTGSPYLEPDKMACSIWC